MELKKEITKELLAESFYELMLTHDFEKITIKMITDSSNVIRPTFYYYFQDKYDLLEWIMVKKIFENTDKLIDMGMEIEALKCIFVSIDKDRKFFTNAFKITGQNSFEEMLGEHVFLSFMKYISKHPVADNQKLKLFRPETIARYYTIGIVNVIKSWLFEIHGNKISADDIFEGYKFMISHTFSDLFKK